MEVMSSVETEFWLGLGTFVVTVIVWVPNEPIPA